MKQKMIIFFMLLGSFSVFAQVKNEQKQILEGKWVLENVSAFEKNVQIQFSAENLDFEAPVEINVQQDELTFVYKENTTKVGYDVFSIDGKYLCFSVCTEWKITDNKLQLQLLPDMDEENPIIIILNYNKK